MKQIQLIELNEINFDIVKLYLDKGIRLPNFQLIFDRGLVSSTSEEKYEELEPWIQWPSVHTGLKFSEHGIFRLGDIVNYKGSQIFETIESRGYSVGCMSAMNAKNKLKKPAFFIPDPWTNTPSDNSYESRLLSNALSQTVNDNSSGKITIKSAISIIYVGLRMISITNMLQLIRELIWALKKPWRKAIFLDFYLTYLFKGYLKKNKADFSVLFLNGGAHIQHHYMLSSSALNIKDNHNPDWYVKKGLDPLLELFKKYDKILGVFLNDESISTIVATGLSQKAFSSPIYYYRLCEHEKFLDLLSIKYSKVEPRMTRDFLIQFNSKLERNNAFEKLSKIYVGNERLFGEIDVRDNELFVTLDYPFEVKKSDKVLIENNKYIDLIEHIVFVAIKNGEHQARGFVYIDPRINIGSFSSGDHISNLYTTILESYPQMSKNKT